MGKFKNVAGITEISFDQNMQCYCPLGQAYCTYQMHVTFVPGEWIPDYVDVEKVIRKMSGDTLTLESATYALFEYIWNECEPKSLEVKCHCDDAVHFPATVVKYKEKSNEEK